MTIAVVGMTIAVVGMTIAVAGMTIAVAGMTIAVAGMTIAVVGTAVAAARLVQSPRLDQSESPAHRLNGASSSSIIFTTRSSSAETV